MNASTASTLLFALLLGVSACDSDDSMNGGSGGSGNGGGQNEGDAQVGAGGSGAVSMSFFVSSQTNPDGDLGGLEGADTRCRTLATAAGSSGATWHAYLSASDDGAGKPVDARDRIGTGPWYNAKGAVLAEDLDALHTRFGDAEVFLDENGDKIPGQWPGSPAPVEHDVLTGSTSDGRLMEGMTCSDWTSNAAAEAAQVGHSDGLGPGGNAMSPFNSWNSSHANESCANTAPRGGAGRIYCFAVD